MQTLIRPKDVSVLSNHHFHLPLENIDDFLTLGPPVIEDCAQSLGARYHGTMTGTSGEIAMLSFYATKVITTGHGGMVISSYEKLLERIRDLREYDKKNEYMIRYNYCITDLQGRMGRIQLEKLPSFLRERTKRAQWYEKHLS